MGHPSVRSREAVAGFARKQGVEPSSPAAARRAQREKSIVAKVAVKGASLDAALAGIVAEALKKLPIPKVMRWGSGDAQFVRPVHGLVMLHGSNVVPGTVLGLHVRQQDARPPLHGRGRDRARERGRIRDRSCWPGMWSPISRKENRRSTRSCRQKQGSRTRVWASTQALLDEVTALVEHPSVYVGEFDKAFLEVPQECLILTMRQNQKYFPLFDAAGKLTGKFLIVSNMQVADPRHIIGGNQRVVRPRLEDARFFYDQDRKQRLEERIPLLAKVVYHNKLGSQLERVQRVKLLAGKIARVLNADALQAERAAELAKADLLTGMVGEFPELQGIMGRYYALHDKEPAAVADAIEAHYRPRFAGDSLPEGPIACAVALADKLDAIAGLFSIGQQPTGDKDPFGLRRAALGVIRILVEHKLHLSLKELIHAAFEPFASKPHTRTARLLLRPLRRLPQGAGLFHAAGGLGADQATGQSRRRAAATGGREGVPGAAGGRKPRRSEQADREHPEAGRSEGRDLSTRTAGDLKEPAEKALQEAIQSTSAKAKALYEKGDYTGYLKSFSVLKAPVDTFFDKVMVMVDDEKLRRSRLALLRDLRESMNRVADLSKLAT